MMFDSEVLRVIKNIQSKYSELILCGSASLIMREVLPNRDMSDIDFVVNETNLTFTDLIPDDGYCHLNQEDGYKSYSYTHEQGFFIRHKINILIFHDDITLNTEITSGVKHQALRDIINWKEKYNRSKDIEDINNITTKAIEETLLSRSN